MASRLRYLPVALLVVTAVLQIILVYRAHLSPWLGGGFGMFSTTDMWTRRQRHVCARSPGVRREMSIPPQLGRMAREALALPTPAHLRRLALATAAELTDDEPVKAIEVQIWAPRFDRETLAPSSTLLAALEVPRGTP